MAAVFRDAVHKQGPRCVKAGKEAINARLAAGLALRLDTSFLWHTKGTDYSTTTIAESQFVSRLQGYLQLGSERFIVQIGHIAAV